MILILDLKNYLLISPIRFTSKWTMVASMLCYSTYIAAQFYPTYGTLMPSAVLVGLAAAPLWSAKCTYVSHVGKR